MSAEIRLYLAVTGARRRLRDGYAPEQAARAAAGLVDVPVGDVLRLASEAERECERTRELLRIEKERRADALEG